MPLAPSLGYDAATVDDRPRWHVDAKWVSGLLLFLSLLALTPVVALYRTAGSQRMEPAFVAFFGRLMEGPPGEEREQRANQPSAEEVGLSFHRRGAVALQELVRQQGGEEGAGGLAGLEILTVPGRGRIARLLPLVTAPALVFGVLAVYFSAGFGRLGTPALAAFLASVLALGPSFLAGKTLEAMERGSSINSVVALVLQPVAQSWFELLRVLAPVSGLAVLVAVAGHRLGRGRRA